MTPEKQQITIAEACGYKLNKWLPIESAPKDGSDILLYSPEEIWHNAPLVGQNISTHPERVTVGSWAIVIGDQNNDPYEGWESWDGGFTEENPPTHWMPMPDRPDNSRPQSYFKEDPTPHSYF